MIDPTTSSPLVDPFGRGIDDLRLSLTSACDLACSFCHHEGARPSSASRLDTHDVARVCRVAARLGIRYLKLTGGEPLLRRDIVEIVREAAPLFKEVSLVTNGQLLEGLARRLREAGLARVNVSLHTLDPAAYRALTHGEIAPVLRGIRAAREAGLTPVKANAVVGPGTARELSALVAWAAREDVVLQLIEVHGPPGTSPAALAKRTPVAAIEAELARRAIRVEVSRMHDRRRYQVDGAIVEVTRPQENPDFCRACTRLRVTADGYLKPCLMRNDDHVDLIARLRRGATDADLVDLFLEAARRRAPFWTPALGRDLAPEPAGGVPS